MKTPFQKGCHSSQEQCLFASQVVKRTLPQAGCFHASCHLHPHRKTWVFLFNSPWSKRILDSTLRHFQILTLRGECFLTKSKEAEKNPERPSLSYLCYETARGTSDRSKVDTQMGFPGGTSGKEPACQCRRQKRRGFKPWVREIPWRRAWQPTPVFLPGETRGQRSLVGYSPLGGKQSDISEATSHGCKYIKFYFSTYQNS